MKLLFIEDESILLLRLIRHFTNLGFVCDRVENVMEAIVKLNSVKYDGIILDIILPDGNGIDLIPKIKHLQKNAGIIVISSNNSLHYKLLGLNAGADDYLVKPFDLPELEARINALHRRIKHEANELLKFEDFTIDIQSNQFFYNDILVNLTRKELQLLIFFVSNRNRVLGKTSIAEHIWGDNFIDADNFDAIYVHLKNLRKKMMEVSGRDYIKTVWGMGYKFSIE